MDAKKIGRCPKLGWTTPRSNHRGSRDPGGGEKMRLPNESKAVGCPQKPCEFLGARRTLRPPCVRPLRAGKPRLGALRSLASSRGTRRR